MLRLRQATKEREVGLPATCQAPLFTHKPGGCAGVTVSRIDYDVERHGIFAKRPRRH